MKKVWGLGFLSIAAMGMLIGVFAGQKNEIKKANASSYVVNSVPTTIDLNDTSSSDIRSYYSSLNSLATNQRQGTNLLKNLKPILKNGQTYYSYGSSATTAVWQIYEIVDRDWVKSPATSISGYDSSTKIITGYKYGTSNSNTGTNPYIHALYVNRDVTNQTRAWGNHNQGQWGINQEHVWAKSCGFNDNSPGAGARGDIMHLWAGNGKVNGTYHSNYYYGYVDTSKSYNDASEYASTLSGNRKGLSKTLGGTYTVFEPQDSDKGDIARALFYMAARYNYLSGSDSDGIDAGNPNLEIVSILNWAPGSSYTSSTSKKGQMGIVQDLLEWNRLDPPDEWEIHRNNLCYNNFTNNRNPFIDFPEWAEYIWGTVNYNGSSFESYNSNPSGYAKPSTDTINGYNGTGSTPTVNSVSVSPSSLDLDLNGTKTGTLTATVNVSNGASETVNWTIEPSGQGVTVSNGIVTAANNATIGTYIVSAISTVDNSKYGTCVVNVEDSSQQSGEFIYLDATMGAGTSSFESTVNGKAGVKAGTSSASGSVNITIGPGTISLRFYAAAWNGVSGESIVISGASVSPSEIEIEPDTGISGGGSEYTLAGLEEDYFYEVSVSDVTNETVLTVTSKGGKRFAVWGAQFTKGTTSIEPTAIFASVENDLYYVGQTIKKSDITLKDDYGTVINDFEFEDYTFNYEDADGGNEATLREYEISYNNMETLLEIYVARKSYQTPTSTTTYNSTEFFDLSSSYKTNQSVNLDGTYFNVDGYYYKTGSSLSFSNGSSKAPGSIRNTSPYPVGISNVTFAGASPDIQLSVDGRHDWVDLANASSSTEYYYFKAFYKNIDQTGYVNISSFTVDFKGQSPHNVSNFIMFEDTEDQCYIKLPSAIDKLNEMSLSDKQLFLSSNDYVIATARERLNAWARNQNKELTLTNGNFTLSNNRTSLLINQTEESSTIVIVLISALSLLAIGVFLLKTKKKED